jgi:gliding motility-associated-like protein
MKRLALTVLVLVATLLAGDVYATHYMGGEITWECLPNGRYRFKMRVYRECYYGTGSAATFGATETIQSTGGGVASISMTRVHLLDISPQCNTNPAFPRIICPGMVNSAPNLGAQQENYYTSDATYPTGVLLTGVPPPTGWTFSWSGCCRNPSTNVTNSMNLNWYLRAKMYPYNNQNVNPCFDWSPAFAEIPRTVICSGYPFQYNHVAWDNEKDSLTYEWGQPMISASGAITTYAPGYSFNNPLPGVMHNPNNVSGTVNINTGVINFTSFTNGAFVTSVKVTAWKCGIRVAEIWRDIQIVLLACNTNNPPNVPAPFIDPNTGLYTKYVDTVFAGDFVSFPISGTDFEFLPNMQPQTVLFTATSPQFGLNYTSSTTGCLQAPCATLNPPPPISAPFAVQSTFNWQTDCDHLAVNLGCGTQTNVFTFLIKVQDDFCPAPAIKFSNVTIYVLDKPTLPAPRISCTRVQPNGDVELSWLPVVDSMNTFNSYHIYSSTSPTGPFTVIDSIFNIHVNSYTHVGANANAGPVYYHTQTRAGCQGNAMSPRSDTVSTIHLDVVNPGAAFGIANLSWNAQSTPLPASSSGVYLVYREYPTGTWSLIDSTSNLFYVDTVTFCNQLLNYRIEILDTTGYDTNNVLVTCYSRSSIDGDFFQDNTAPNMPVIDSVSVLPIVNLPFLSWSKTYAPDALGYLVYENLAGVWTVIDTIWGVDSTSYVHLLGIPCAQSHQYAVAAFDSCGNVSLMSPPHRTILVYAEPDICDDKINISWNEYINMDPVVGGYDIYYNENGGAFSLLGNVATGVTTFEHVGLNNSAFYCYIIQAYNPSKNVTSSSCEFCVSANKPNQPQFVYIMSASVGDNNDYIELNVHTDMTAKVTEYRVMRSTDDIVYNQIAALPPPAGALLTYQDVQAQVKEMSYYYQVVVVDSCGVEVLTSNTALSVHLKVEANDDMSNTLTWNDYDGYLGSPTSYDIYRKVDGVLDLTPIITNIPSATGTYTDVVDNLGSSTGQFEYYVVANEGGGNMYFFAEASQSNTVLALQKPRLYVPNAFTPGGSIGNNVFMPLGMFIDANDYLFMVFDRWGSKIFETTNISEGWDGNINGKSAPTGVYIYFVKFKTSTGEYFEKRGTVTLLR